jgi:hypothetical protein
VHGRHAIAVVAQVRNLPEEATFRTLDFLVPLAGIGFKLLSVLAFTFMVTGVKVLGDSVPVGQIVFRASVLSA